MNAGDVINALNTREFDRWSEDQIKEGLAALHKENTVGPHAAFYNGLIQTLERSLESKERQQLAEQGNQQLAAMQANVRHGSEIVSQLEQHRSLHRKILFWSKVAGVTGLVLVGFEICKLWHASHSSSEAPHTISTQQLQQPSHASATSEPSKATNQAPPPPNRPQ